MYIYVKVFFSKMISNGELRSIFMVKDAWRNESVVRSILETVQHDDGSKRGFFRML